MSEFSLEGSLVDVVDELSDVVLVVVLVEACDVPSDVAATGVDCFENAGAKTCAVPNPKRCPQYLLSSISSSKYISCIRKKA